MPEKRALVTGATGFIAGHLIDFLVRSGWSVAAFTRRRVEAEDADRIAVFDVPCSDSEKMLSAWHEAGRIHAVFHLAASIPRGEDAYDSDALWEANVEYTRHLLDLFVASEAEAFVFTSSFAVIGKPVEHVITEHHPVAPLTDYGRSKLEAESICNDVRKRTGRRVVTLRIGSPYGVGMPPDTVLPQFVRSASEGRDIAVYGHGERTQSFVHVGDIAQGMLRAAEHSVNGLYNLAHHEDIAMHDLAERAVRLFPWSGSRILYAGKPDAQEGWKWRIDLSKAARDFGYWPGVMLDSGLKEYADSLRNESGRRTWWMEA